MRTQERKLSAKPTKEELEKFLEALEGSKIYKSKAAERKGTTKDNRPVTDVVAEILLEQIKEGKDLLDDIDTIKRVGDYFISDHFTPERLAENKASNREEEIFAKTLHGKPFFADYQVPLKCTRSDSAGKIDLVLHNDFVLYLCELKMKTNQDTLLRTVLEIETYWRIVDEEKLKEDYKKVFNSHVQEIKKAIVIFKDSRQCKELHNSDFSSVQKLMEKYRISVIVADGLEKAASPEFYRDY